MEWRRYISKTRGLGTWLSIKACINLKTRGFPLGPRSDFTPNTQAFWTRLRITDNAIHTDTPECTNSVLPNPCSTTALLSSYLQRLFPCLTIQDWYHPRRRQFIGLQRNNCLSAQSISRGWRNYRKVQITPQEHQSVTTSRALPLFYLHKGTVSR